jgi:hypothetical protein
MQGVRIDQEPSVAGHAVSTWAWLPAFVSHFGLLPLNEEKSLDWRLVPLIVVVCSTALWH